METHDGVVGSFVRVDILVREDSHDEVVSELLGLFKKGQMPDMEEVKGSADIDHGVPGVPLPALGKLEDGLRGGHEVGDPGPGGLGVGVTAQLGGAVLVLLQRPVVVSTGH